MGRCSIRSDNVRAVGKGLQTAGTIHSYVCANTWASSRFVVNARRTSRGGFPPHLAPSMACPFSKEIYRKPLTVRELRRSPTRPIFNCQPAAVDHPSYRQPAFPNIVYAVYSAMLREMTKKGDEARFKKVERGKFSMAR